MVKFGPVLARLLIIKLNAVMSFGGPQQVKFLEFLWCLRCDLGPLVPSVHRVGFLTCIWVFIRCQGNPY